jgi:hypothetical protein
MKYAETLQKRFSEEYLNTPVPNERETFPLTASRLWDLGTLRASPLHATYRRIASLARRLKKCARAGMIISESRARSWAYLREDNQNNKSMQFPKVDGVPVGGPSHNEIITHKIHADVHEIDLQ